MANGALDRDKPRTCTVDYAKNDNFPLAPVDKQKLKQQMEEILEIINSIKVVPHILKGIFLLLRLT